MNTELGDYKEKFQKFIVRLAQQGVEQGLPAASVVLLVDEYDKPITDLLENAQKVQEKNQASVRSLVSAQMRNRSVTRYEVVLPAPNG